MPENVDAIPETVDTIPETVDFYSHLAPFVQLYKLQNSILSNHYHYILLSKIQKQKKNLDNSKKTIIFANGIRR